jgi:hypothetical protein
MPTIPVFKSVKTVRAFDRVITVIGRYGDTLANTWACEDITLFILLMKWIAL